MESNDVSNDDQQDSDFTSSDVSKNHNNNRMKIDPKVEDAGDTEYLRESNLNKEIEMVNIKSESESDDVSDNLEEFSEIQNLLTKYQMLQTKARLKDNLIDKLREAMESDDQVKLELRNRISQLRENLRSLKENVKNAENLNEDELNQLLNDINKKKSEIEIEEDKELLMASPVNLYNMHIVAHNQQLKGNAMLNDYQVRVYLANTKTCWGKFIIWWDSVIDFFTPFKSQMQHVTARFDKNVEGVFLFTRYLFIFNLLVFIVAIYFLINHFLIYDFSSDETFCNTFIPCAILYSRFASSEKHIYAFTFIAFCLVILFGLISRWSEFKRHEILQNLFDSDNVAYSKTVFNPWDWHANDEDKCEDTRQRIKNIFTIGVAESEIKERIKHRSAKKKCILFLRRLVSIILSIIILAIDAACVFSLYLLQSWLFYIDEDKSTYSILDYIALSIPAVGILIINAIIPILLELCVDFERWDFNSTRLVQLTWRVYIAKLFTVAIVYTLVIIFTILEKTTEEVFGGSSFDFNLKLQCSTSQVLVNNTETLSSYTASSLTSYSNCKEDDAATKFLINLLTDFASRKITPLVIFLLRYLYFKKWKKQKKYKSKYEVTDAITSILLFNVQIYLLYPYFPYIVWLSPFLLYFDFKFEYINVMYYYDKPERMSLQEKSGFFIMTLFTFTMIGVIVLFIFYFVNPLTHWGYMECYTGSDNTVYVYYNNSTLCGPFDNNEAIKDVVYDKIKQSSFVWAVYEVLANPLYLLLIAFLLAIIIAYSMKVSNAYEFYIKEKRKESKNTQSAMGESIKKLRDQVKFLKLTTSRISR